MAFFIAQSAIVTWQNMITSSVLSKSAKNKPYGGHLALASCSKRCFSGINTELFKKILADKPMTVPHRKNSVLRVKLNNSLCFAYHIATAKIYIQKRNFRSENIKKEVNARNGFMSSAFGFGSSDERRQKKSHIPGFQEKLKLVPENEKKSFMIGYLAALEYSNEQKNKRMQLRSVVISTALLAVGLYFVLRAFGIPHSLFSNVEEVDPENIDITFKDVQGIDEAKMELDDIVAYLRDPERYLKMGARLPKGVLLVGPPGTGKTLLARAIAGEAQVPFFQASGSEFDELFVGQGARRIRDLFGRAKEKSPCIIFIDEIDSVGAKRVADAIHPHANQTVNQLLAEMDGFNSSDGVIIIGATNRMEDLDEALLRPGRFDVHVQVPYPDLDGRLDIIKLYLDRIDHDGNIDIDALARGTTGFTGADIENLINQAALRAAADSCLAVGKHHIEEARDRVLMGPARLRGRLPDETANKITAYHEAGHAVVGMLTKDAIPVHKVTIIPRGNALGHTAMLPEKDEYHLNKAQILAQLDTLMAGRVAEEIIFGPDRVTTGAADDLRKATDLATKMVKTFGMSDRVGLRISTEEKRSLISVNQLSPVASELIDSEINRLLKESYERAKDLLLKNKKKHTLLAEALLEYETLSVDEVKELFEKGRVSHVHQPERSKRRLANFSLNPQVLVAPMEKIAENDEKKEN